jgi:outer membrane lipoprotein-sorting protein
MTNTTIRRAGIALALAVGATVVLLQAPAFAHRVQVARAEAVRTRCIGALGARRSWSADVVQTENGTDGKRSVSREELLVRRSGESRIALTETDSQGHSVVSTTIRHGSRMVTRRVNADGSTITHVLEGVRPAIGINLDNALGQTVQAVADAKPLKVVGRDEKGGADSDKLQLGPGHYVWISRATGLPVEEQVVSDGDVAHDVRFSDVQADAPASDSEFDASRLGSADETVTEDLGFREVASPATAVATIGFTPLSVLSPQGFSAGVQGYVDPSVPTGDAPAEAAFVSSFSNGTDDVLVTQARRTSIGDAVPPGAHDGPDPARAISVAGHPAVIYDDGMRRQLVFARRDVLVTIEGEMSESSMRAFAEQIR